MKNIIKTLVLAGLFCQAQPAFAAGFYLSEQSVSSMGTAYSANTAGLDDAGTVYTNPAGMTSLPKCNDFVGGITYIFPRSKYHDKGTINALGQPMRSNVACGPCATNTNGGQIGNDAWIPYLSYVKQLGCGWAAGLTINAPFGLSTEYNERWFGRYYTTRSEVQTTNINPAIAYDITDNLTIGAGISAQYLHVVLKNMVDFGLIGFNASGQNPNLIGLLEQQDGKAIVHGSGWGVGGNVGLLYKFNCDRTRIGVHYRSQVHYHITNGHVKYKDVPTAPVNLTPAFVNGGAKAKVTLPDLVSIGLMHRWNSCLTLYADAQWTNWNTLKKLTIKFKEPAPNLQETTTTFKWKSVWRFAVGGKYQLNCNWAVRLGYLYDQTPSRSDYYRSPRVPDEDRQLIGFGLQYQLNDCIGIDFGYSHVFFKTAHVNNTKGILNQPQDSEIVAKGGLHGRWKTFAELIGLQIHASF